MKSFTHTDLVEYQEDVVERDRADEVQEEPGLQVVLGDQLGIEDHLFGIVLLHDPCNERGI